MKWVHSKRKCYSPDSRPRHFLVNTGVTRLQTEDDWDKYLAKTGQSVLVIAPDSSDPDTPHETSISGPVTIEDDSSQETITQPLSSQNCSQEENSGISKPECTNTTSSIASGITVTGPLSSTAVIGTLTIDHNVQNTSKSTQQQQSNITGTSEAPNISTTTNSSPTDNKTNAAGNQASTSLADVGIVMEHICSQVEHDTTKDIVTYSKKTIPVKSHDFPPLSIPPGERFPLNYQRFAGMHCYLPWSDSNLSGIRKCGAK